MLSLDVTYSNKSFIITKVKENIIFILYFYVGTLYTRCHHKVKRPRKAVKIKCSLLVQGS